MYSVEVSPAAEEIFYENFARGLEEFGEAVARELLDSYDNNISFLEFNPLVGCKRFRYIPKKYMVFLLWKHLWFVFQIYEDEKIVKIEYIIDDRQNYGSFIN